MKKNKITDAISGIHEKYLNEFYEIEPKILKKFLFLMVPLTACAVLLFLLNTSPYVEKNHAFVTVSAGIDKTSDNPYFHENYCFQNDNEFIYYKGYVYRRGMLVANVNLEYLGFTFVNENKRLSNQIYAIKDLNPFYAILYKTNDNYVIYVNTEYVPDTLEQFINDLDLKDNLEKDNPLLKKIIDEHLDEKSILDDFKAKTFDYELLSVTDKINRNIYFGVTTDNYLVIYASSQTFGFYIGSDLEKLKDELEEKRDE